MRYLMHLSFEGTDYCGWQRQPFDQTVQAVLEEALSKLLNVSVTLVGCSRTDSGVHARSFYCHFDIPFLSLKEEKIVFVLNDWVGSSIRVFSICRVDDAFHAQKSVQSKIYEYRLALFKNRSPFRYRFVWYLKGRERQFDQIHQYLLGCVGEHDFSAFCCEPDRYKSRVREINFLSFYRQGDEWVLKLQGNGFLYKMVRNIVGTFVEFSYKNRSIQELILVLLSQDRVQAGPTAPPQGLSLIQVNYDYFDKDYPLKNNKNY